MRPDFIALLDAAYALDVSESKWVDGIFRGAEPILDDGHGMYMFRYDASNPARLQLGSIYERNVARPISSTPEGRAFLSNVDANFVRRTYLSEVCARVSELPEFKDAPFVAREVFGAGIRDIQVVNAGNVGGTGWVIGSYLGRVEAMTERFRTTWTRVAGHIAAGSRLRDAATKGASARLSPSGELQDGDASAKRARDSLRRSVLAYERAHTRKNDDHAAVADWRVLAEARWSLLHSFERNGERYIVARTNQSDDRGPRALTPRECQVVNLAVLGHTNKLIAYELGITHATVRVLIARAAAKLRVTSRAALVRTYSAQTEKKKRDET